MPDRPAARGRVFANKDDVAVQAKADGERMYVVVDSGVFDITDFRHLHPGGEELFLAVKPGHDLTKMFIGAGARAGDPSSRSHKHSANARRMLETYRIGALPHGYRSTGGERSDDVPGVDDVQVDWSKGMVWQAGMMGDAYQPWINSTSVPFPVHYWDNHGFGAFCNKYSMCPWYVPCLLWIPHMLWMCGAGLGWDVFQWCFSRAECAAVQMNALRRVGWCLAWFYRVFTPDPYGYVAFDHMDENNNNNNNTAAAAAAAAGVGVGGGGPGGISNGSSGSGYGGAETEGHGLTALWTGFLAGYVFFTFFEWAVHKYFFHMNTSSMMGNMIHFMFHGSHHLSPQDHMRLVFPPVPLVLVRSAVAWGLIQFCAADRATYYSAMGGVYFGYLLYDMMHYGNHHKIPIPGMQYVQNLRVMKQIKHHHLRHHFGDDQERVSGDCNFGLSIGASVWDDIMGTVCSERDPATGEIRKQSKMRRVLGLDQGSAGWMQPQPAEQTKLD